MKVKIQLDPRYQEERKPLVYTLSHKGKRKYITTGFTLAAEQIKISDLGIKLKTGAKEDHANSIQINLTFNKLLSYVDTNSYVLKNKLPDDAFRIILNDVFGVVPLDNTTTIRKVCQEYIDRLMIEGRSTTATSYKEAMRAFLKFGGDKLRIEDIDYKWLNRFKSESIRDGRKINTIGVYCRSMKAMIFNAIKEGLTSHNPFIGFKIPKEKTRKRNIDKEDINKIRKLKYIPGTREFDARNYFLFSFDCMGMNFLDMALMKVSQYRDGRIRYNRHKTDDLFTISLNKESKEIIEYYSNGKSMESYVFPIILDAEKEPGTTSFDHYYKTKRKLINKALSTIASDAGIDEKITTYTARHTWASIARRMGFAIDQIQRGLGHESSATTETYVQEFDTDVIDFMNDKITLG